MTAYLPGGAKYTGALYGDNTLAAGPTKRVSAPKMTPAPKPPTTDAAAIALVDQLYAEIAALKSLVGRQSETIELQREVIALKVRN